MLTPFEYFLSIVCSLGVIQTLLIAGVLFFRKENRLAHFLLAIMLLLTSLRITKPLLVLFATLPFVFENLGIAAMLLIIPLLLIYLMILLENRQIIKWIDGFHLIPFVVYMVFSWQLKIYQSSYYSLIMIHNLVYLGACIYLVWSHQKSHEPNLYRWAILLVSSISIIWLGYVYAWLFHSTIQEMLKGATTIYSLLIYGLMYLVFTKKLIFNEKRPIKYQRSKITESDSKLIFEKIKNLITNEKLYLEPDLSLKELTKKTAISEREISQVVNQNAQTNFSDWVNGFRVELAKVKLIENQKDKIATIAFECGFNTLSSFNTIFKNKTGFTPSEYRNFYKIIPN